MLYQIYEAQRSLLEPFADMAMPDTKDDLIRHYTFSDLIRNVPQHAT